MKSKLFANMRAGENMGGLIRNLGEPESMWSFNFLKGKRNFQLSNHQLSNSRKVKILQAGREETTGTECHVLLIP